MEPTGTVTIFNCTPYTIEISINGQVIEQALPPMDTQPQALPPFPRVDVDNPQNEAVFGANNTLDTRSEDMPNIAYRVPTPTASYALDVNLVVYVFNRGAFLSYEGKAIPLNMA